MKFSLFIVVSFIFTACMITGCKKYYSTQDTQVLQALTDTFSIGSADWTLDTSEKYFSYTKTGMVNLESNTNNTGIIDSGAVLIYLSVDTAKTYELLPADYVNNYYFKGLASEGQISISAYFKTDTIVPAFPVNIKVITFPSAIASKIINFDPHDYNATKKALHLDE